MTKKPQNNYVQLIGIATQMVAMIGVGFWGGHQLDQYLGEEKPVYTLVIGLVVMVASMYLTVKQVNKVFEDKE